MSRPIDNPSNGPRCVNYVRTWEEVARAFRERTGEPCSRQSAEQTFKRAMHKLRTVLKTLGEEDFGIPAYRRTEAPSARMNK